VVVRTVALMIVRRLVGMINCGPRPDADAVEIAVLRHQLAVLRRQIPRPRYTPADRMLLATLAKLLPRERWPVFLVTQGTLLRWHGELVARRWTYPAPGAVGAAWTTSWLSWCAWPGRTLARAIGGWWANAVVLAYGCRRRRYGGSCAATASARLPDPLWTDIKIARWPWLSVDVDGCVEQFDTAFARITGGFGRREARQQARAFLLGLLSVVDTRSCGMPTPFGTICARTRLTSWVSPRVY
jgi:hypothetical protein